MSAAPDDAFAGSSPPSPPAELAAESSALLNLAAPARARAASARAEAADLASDASARAVVASALRLAAALAEPSACSAAPLRCAAFSLAAAAVALPADDADGSDAPRPASARTPRRPRSLVARRARLNASPLLSLSLPLPPPARASHARDAAPSRPRRACARCGAVKTPQWRSGPSGSKSLCNACGTRYRKVASTVDGCWCGCGVACVRCSTWSGLAWRYQ